MSFNFPLILSLATIITGLIWLLDTLFLRPKRLAAVAALTQTLGEASPELEATTAPLLREPMVVEYSISFFPVLAIVLVLRSFLFEPFQIPTGSMIPTLLVGDFIVVNKYSYGLRLPVLGTKVLDVNLPQNGEVMVFIPPHKDEYYIKRVIGIPGDKIGYADKTLYINDVAQPQKFIAQIPPNNPEYLVFEEIIGEGAHQIHKKPYRGAAPAEWIVPEGKYFMMGDNRDLSSDSRYWGYAAEENIVGKAVGVWMHKEPGLALPTFSNDRWIK
jgi:signal peptidase I